MSIVLSKKIDLSKRLTDFLRLADILTVNLVDTLGLTTLPPYPQDALVADPS